MSIRGIVRWIIDHILVAFAIALIIVNGASFGVDLPNKGFLYAFEVLLVIVFAVGAVAYLIVPRGKPKKAEKT